MASTRLYDTKKCFFGSSTIDIRKQLKSIFRFCSIYFVSHSIGTGHHSSFRNFRIGSLCAC